MSGHVYYRFKSQKDLSRITFNGTGISVWDLKREIIMENKMGKGTDFDFAIYNADTEEEYTDDNVVIPRSTTVIARRLPASRPGRGNAQRYIATGVGGSVPVQQSSTTNWNRSGGNMSKRFDGKDAKSKEETAPAAVVTDVDGQNEDDAIKAMFAFSSEQWDKTQEKMATATRVPYTNYRTGKPGGGGGANNSNASHEKSAASSNYHHTTSHKPPPSGYICFRCGQKGHWIQECPTNDDREFDNRPKLKRTTGIPKSFLQTVEAPSKDQTGVMVTPDGTFVTARPDSASWDKHRALKRNMTAGDVQNMKPTDPDLTCGIDNKLLKSALKTPCCGTAFCEGCIRDYLRNYNLVCPECEAKLKSLDALVVDEERRARVQDYVDAMVRLTKSDDDEKKEAEGAQEEKDSNREASTSAETKQIVKEETPANIDESQSKDTPGPAIETSKPSVEPELRPESSSRSQSHLQHQHQQSMPQFQNPNMSFNNNFQPGMMNPQFNGGIGMMMTPQQQMMFGGNPFQMVQANIIQLENQLNNPQLTPQMRMQIQMNLQNLRMMAVNLQRGGGGNMNQMGMGGGMNPMMMNGGMNRMNWTNPFPNQQPAGEESPYMRLPVHQRRQGAKRQRPADFLDLSGESPADKLARVG